MVESFLPLEKLMEKLGSRAFEELLLFYCVKNDAEKLKETLTTDACYDAEDLLDDFEVEALRRQVMKQRSIGGNLRNFFGSPNPIAFRCRMGHQIKKIRERFDEIANMMHKFNLTPGLDDRRGRAVQEREPSHSFVRPSDIIGRDEDREKIIELLMQTSDGESETVSVIPIVGIGGLGKTALAKLVYNDQRVEEHFELKIWICVSEDFGERQIMTKIIKSITGPNQGDLDTEQLQQIMRSCLNGKRYLFVMDDVWNEDPKVWDELKSLLWGGAKGSKILVTTRSNKVASIMGTMRGTGGYKLEGLPYESCLSLFMKCAFKEGQHKNPNLVKIGEEIVKKSGGIPLAVRTLGSLLYGSTDEHYWEYVRDNEIWKLEQKENDILPALKLSYDQLPPHLKQCFAYCSIFPKDYDFDSVLLIRFWMAHGLLQSPNENEEPENIGMRYLNELLSRSFFQDFSNGMLPEGFEIFFFKMHDLMHDLAQLVAKGEFLIVGSDCQSIPKRVCHLSFVGANTSRNDFSSLLSDLRRARTILFPINDEKTNQSILTSCISKSQFLRVIDLSETAIEVLSREIGNLKHLRYLDLSDNDKIKKLPNSICELHSLQTLSLGGCRELEELPKDIRYLVSLRMFMVSTKQKSLLESGIGCLSSLRFLMISDCENLEYLFDDIDQLCVLRQYLLLIATCCEIPQLIRDSDVEGL
ncbi:hypothetical protein WN943_027436 [Citrus x changshan-huyou]